VTSPATGPFGLESTLPTFWYQREDVYALEQEHIFFREWLCVGRAEPVPRPGDHRVIDVCGQSIILLRNSQGALHAFYNVCRHRGARLCSPSGAEQASVGLAVKGGLASGLIICPYHAWTYDLDGQLLRAPHLAQESGFDAANVQLYPVLLYPNLFISAAREHVAAFVLQPTGPKHTRIDCHFLFEPHAMAQPDFDPSDTVDFWDLVNRQDWNICELVQAGGAARVHTVGVFSPMEDWNLDIRRYVSERIGPFVRELK
jgi:phenylpropionate dioxygenase-like ring-hydroxylating dioxygenase large terminal subunit